MLEKVETISNVVVANVNNLWYTSLLGLLVALYWTYQRKYKNYKYLQPIEDIKHGSVARGKCPPFFPNGWYSLINSDELAPNEVKYIDYCGRDIVLFRGTNNKVYALGAFCAHMGANLGFGGKVKNSQCIQCPFHGWLFDGETGNCVQSEKMAKKTVNQYEYRDLDMKTECQVDGAYLHKCFEGEAKLKKYIVKELNNSILIWYDSRDEYQDKYLYEPLEIVTKLSFRGESINHVNCHIQEIPENGADIRHFDFLHTNVFTYVKFIQFEWSMKSHRAAEPDIFTYMKHEKEYFNEFKMKLLHRYINEENKKYLNIISLDCYVKLFSYKFFLFNLTGFQVGPGLVYLFLKSYFFESIFAQSVTPLKKFHLKVSHKIYTSGYIPYWLSSYMLYSEVKQLFSDMAIWNNKIFGSKLAYNMKTEADKNLYSWRNWYSQFYEGCHDFEKALEKYDW